MKNFNFYKHVMSGVSNMIPFVVAGGILIAIAFLLDSGNIGASNYGWGTPISSWFGDVGKLAFSFMLPVFAGFIAYSIADRPGFVPGFVGGALAGTGGSGFLGALLIGFLAGYTVNYLKELFKGLPRAMAGIKPVLLFPLIGTAIAAAIMIIINYAMAPINNTLNSWLVSMDQSSAIILGLIVGGMMAVDMGGPINKTAYVFATASLASGQSTMLMASVMVGGMTPPLGIAIATTFFKNKFTKQQQEAGKTNYIMGISFITEGAIPFAAANPKVVIPSIIAGSSVAGFLSALFKASSPAPHGGLFVVPVISSWGGFLIALIVGSIITAFLLKIFLPEIKEEI